MWTRLSIGIRQTGASPLSELMLVSFIFSLCLKQFQLVSTQNMSKIRNMAFLYRVKTRRAVSKPWSCHTFSESDHSVQGKVPTRRLQRKKLMHKALMAFADTVTLCLKSLHFITIFLHVEKLVLLSLRKKFTVAKRQRARRTSKTILSSKIF